MRENVLRNMEVTVNVELSAMAELLINECIEIKLKKIRAPSKSKRDLRSNFYPLGCSGNVTRKQNQKTQSRFFTVKL